MENIKAFFGFPNSNDSAKHRCREYLATAVAYGHTQTPVPPFIADVEQFLAETEPVTATDSDGHGDSADPSSAAAPPPATDNTPGTLPTDNDPFWLKWDEYKEDALNLLTTDPENQGKIPDGEFVAMWRHLEQGRLPASTAPPEAQHRRRSSLARVRLA